MGVESQAMILAGKDGDDLTIFVPDKDIKIGSEVS